MTNSKTKTRDKISRVQLLPTVASDLRGALMSGLHSIEDYKRVVSKGANLFTKDQLERIEKRFESKKATWEEISQILIDHKIEFSKPTFRRHIDQELIPKAIDYTKVDGKRVAVFKNDVITHINFNRFFLKFASVEFIKNFRDALYNIAKISLHEIIGYKTEESSVDAAIFFEFASDRDCEVEDTIARYLPKDHEKRPEIQSKIGQIGDIRNQLDKELDMLSKLLGDTEISFKHYLSIEEEGSHAH